MGITINQCRARRRRAVLRMTWLRDLWSRRGQPTRHAAEETSEQVRAAVAELPPRDREVIVLFYLEELSVAQVAQLLGVKHNAVEVRLHRARQRLKTRLAGLIGD
jgi:RNA polymerase sigma-70 factor (ECF subfamily)